MTLADRIAELIEQHGSLRAAARVLDCDAGYLSRLQSGEKDAPEDWLLRRMKLRRVVTYDRTDGAMASDEAEGWGDDEPRVVACRCPAACPVHDKPAPASGVSRPDHQTFSQQTPTGKPTP